MFVISLLFSLIIIIIIGCMKVIALNPFIKVATLSPGSSSGTVSNEAVVEVFF